jgi:di/tricarboxylate transporter
MILMMALNYLPILVSVSVAATVLLLSKSIKAKDAIESIDWHVLLVIASAFGIAKGIENSGLGFIIAEKIKIIFSPLGILGLVAGIYFLTSIYTEIITNNAAAAMVFPVALSIAQQAGIDPRPFLIVVAIAGSASFATPIGYQTNLMVYGPGGYRFTDFLKVGIPMNLFIGLVTVSIVYLFYYT